MEAKNTVNIPGTDSCVGLANGVKGCVSAGFGVGWTAMPPNPVSLTVEPFVGTVEETGSAVPVIAIVVSEVVSVDEDAEESRVEMSLVVAEDVSEVSEGVTESVLVGTGVLSAEVVADSSELELVMPEALDASCADTL